MMTNRADPASSWTNEVMSAAHNLPFDELDPLDTGATQTAQFLTDFSEPTSPAPPDFHADLWMIDGQTGAMKQLTGLNPVIPEMIPEFSWNSNYTKLIWTQFNLSPIARTSYTAAFSPAPGNPALPTTPATSTPSWIINGLPGQGEPQQPPNWANVGIQLRPSTQSGPLNNMPQSVTPPPAGSALPAFGSTNHDTQTIPLVTTTYLAPWETDLTTLGVLSLRPFLEIQGLDRLGDL